MNHKISPYVYKYEGSDDSESESDHRSSDTERNNTIGGFVNINNRTLPLKRRTSSEWEPEEEDLLLHHYYKLKTNYPRLYGNNSEVANRIFEDRILPKYTFTSINNKLSALLKNERKQQRTSYNTTATTPKTTSTTSGRVITNTNNNNNTRPTTPHKPSNRTTTPTKATSTTITTPTKTTTNNTTTPTKTTNTTATTTTTATSPPHLIWDTEKINLLWSKYSHLKNVSANATDVSIIKKILTDKEFSKFNYQQVQSKFYQLKKINKTHTGGEKEEKDKDEDDYEEQEKEDEKVNTSISRSIIPKFKTQQLNETITANSNRIKDLSHQIELLKRKDQNIINEIRKSSTNNNNNNNKNTTQINIPTTPNFNDDINIISSNTGVVVKNNQDIYVLFPSFLDETEIKFSETLNNRYHVEISCNSKSISNVSHHYIKHFEDKHLYEDPIICKIRQNQVERNGLLFKKKATLFSIDDCNDINILPE